MTDEAFWNRIDNEIIPHMKERQYKYLPYWERKVKILKEVSFETQPDYAHHEWITMGLNLKELYHSQGIQVRSLVEHCANKVGEDVSKFRLEER